MTQWHINLNNLYNALSICVTKEVSTRWLYQNIYISLKSDTILLTVYSEKWTR